MDECLELSLAIVLFVLFALCGVVFLVVLPTVIITCIPREVLLWLLGKYVLMISGTAVCYATAMLWLLLCDARRWLVGASAESDIERGTTGQGTSTAVLEKAGARPAPGDTTADETGLFEDLISTVIGKIVVLAIATAFVFGDLWFLGNVSRTKPVRENIAAALMHELAGLEVLCVLFAILAVFVLGADACGWFGTEERSRRRRLLRKKRIEQGIEQGIEAWKQSQEMAMV